jgi:uncharacterized membrane protein
MTQKNKLDLLQGMKVFVHMLFFFLWIVVAVVIVVSVVVSYVHHKYTQVVRTHMRHPILFYYLKWECCKWSIVCQLLPKLWNPSSSSSAILLFAGPPHCLNQGGEKGVGPASDFELSTVDPLIYVDHGSLSVTLGEIRKGMYLHWLHGTIQAFHQISIGPHSKEFIRIKQWDSLDT